MTYRFILPALLLALLAGCAGPPKSGVTPFDQAENVFANGQYTDAARSFSQLAEQSNGIERQALLFRAAAALARADLLPQARQFIENAGDPANNPRLVMLANLAKGHLALMDRLPQDVLDRLKAAPSPGTSPLHQAEFYRLRADAYTMLGNRLETARELVVREKYLTDKSQIQQNQHAIWEALASLTNRALQQLRSASAQDTLAGWMQLVQIAKSYQLEPEQLQIELAKWRQTYPQHPVQDDILQAFASRKQADVKSPDHIALLLPITGKFAQAAAALRDGFLAAYYEHTNKGKQAIQIYDSGDDPKKVRQVYQKALDDGAQFVVGPLDKDAVKELANEAPLGVPTLALNYLNENEKYTNLYQFGLSPEEEARQVAERAWLDGHVYAAALVPAGPWGERVFASFKERWEHMGGIIVEEQAYDPSQNDFSTPIQMLLNLNDSQHRYRKMSTLLKEDIKFQPRRRQDVDFIFLAAFPRQARAIRPQLKFFHAAELPVYATSHVFTGNLNPERDRDMDGIVFGDMPWVLSESSSNIRSLRTEIERHISEAGSNLQRLYALGIDSFNIIAALNPLRRYSYERYDGETGSLALDDKLRIQRQLSWVTFRSGQPTALDQITP